MREGESIDLIFDINIDEESQDGVSNHDIDDISEDYSDNQVIVFINYRTEG